MSKTFPDPSKFSQATKDYIEKINNERAKKIADLDKRSRKIKSRYVPEAVQGVDYILCPVTQVRFTAIRDPHITGTLGTTVEEYYSHFPELKGIQSSASASKRSSGLKELYIDENGNHVIGKDGKPMTKYKVAQQKAYETLQAVDPITGKRGYDLLGKKSGDTRKYTIDEYGVSIGQNQQLEKYYLGRTSKTADGVYKDNWNTTLEFLNYLTYKSALRPLIFNGIKTHRVAISYKEGDKQADHKFSKSDGFQKGISPLCIGSPQNTRIIDTVLNITKNCNSSITEAQLLNDTGYTKERSDYEFKLFIDLITEGYEKYNGFNSLFVLVEMLKRYKQCSYRDEAINHIAFIISNYFNEDGVEEETQE